MSSRRTQAERSAATKEALLRAARELFAEKGFARTAREEIVERAGVTRGALYHHFADKQDLFRAVFEELESVIVAAVATAAMKAADPAQQLREGAAAFLDACIDPAVRRIVLLDGPSVLGWEQWREIDSRYGLALMREAVTAAMEAGQLDRAPVDSLAQVLLGALTEAAVVVATAKRPRVARREVGETIDYLLDRILNE